MLKALASISVMFQAGMMVVLLITEDWPYRLSEQISILILMLSIIVLVLFVFRPNVIDESWLGMFFKRKRIEEEIKLKELQKKKDEALPPEFDHKVMANPDWLKSDTEN